MKKLLTIEVVQDGDSPAIGRIHTSGDGDMSDFAILAATAQVTLMNAIHIMDEKSNSGGKLTESVTRIVDAVFEGKLSAMCADVTERRPKHERPTGQN
jgi:hypothetical protein